MGFKIIRLLTFSAAAYSAALGAALSVPSGQYPDVQTALNAAQSGDTVLVAPGTYTAVQNGANPQGIFDLRRPITLRSTGGPSVTILQASSDSNPYPAVRVGVSNSVVEGFTIQGSAFGIRAIDQINSTPQPITNVVFRNLVVNPTVRSAGAAVIFTGVSNSLIENCTVVNANMTGISLESSSNNFVLNNTVQKTETQYGLAATASHGNLIAGNTFNNAFFGAMTIISSNFNRIERNRLTGRLAGINITDDAAHTPSRFNSLIKNVHSSSEYDQVDPNVKFGFGIWLNDLAAGNLVHGATTTGFYEGAVAVFNSNNNLIRGNYSYRTHQGGLYMTNDPGSYPQGPGGNPTGNVVQHNLLTGQETSSLLYLSSNGPNDIGFNTIQAGPNTPLTNTSGVLMKTSSGIDYYRNTIINQVTSIFTDSGLSSVNIFMNRNIGTKYQFAAPGVNWDAGPRLGGNFWSSFSASGNPSTTTPFTDFLNGPASDRYPYQSETFGRPTFIQLLTPSSGFVMAAGSQKTISWISNGCAFVDISYKRAGGAATGIVSGFADSGYYHWTVPAGPAPAADYSVQVDCKNSANTATGVTAVSPLFTVTSSKVLLLSPNSDLMANSGATIMTAWQKDATVSTVDLLYSADGSAYSVLASTLTGNSARITLPVLNSNRVQLLLRDSANAANADGSDGYFTVRGNSPRFTSPSRAGLSLGSEALVQWISPQNSVFADLDLIINSSTIRIASNLADFGAYSWLVPDNLGDGGVLRLTFKDSSNATLTSVTSGTFSVQAGQTFADVLAGDFDFTAVDLLRSKGITAGCSATPLLYCPDANVTRRQMAVFMIRTIIGGDTFPYTTTPYFTDVPSTDPNFKWIQKMRDLNITAGCGGTQYCPDDPVTRGQMAVFIIRARLGATANFAFPATASFTDVPSSHSFFKWIQKMKQIGITAGCGASLYCPDATVTRGQMAIFVMRGGFNQLLPSGTPVIASATPATGSAGQTVSVTLTGQNTAFVPGSTSVTAGDLTVGSVSVANSGQLTVQIMAPAGSAAGPRSIVATTGAEEAVLPNGFKVQ